MPNDTANGQLPAIVKRIEKLDAERKAKSADIREKVFCDTTPKDRGATCNACGFDWLTGSIGLASSRVAARFPVRFGL